MVHYLIEVLGLSERGKRMANTIINYYKILGVSKSASEQEIKKAFRQKILHFHPDHNKAPDANQRTQLIIEAYEVLKDKNRREAYNRVLETNQKATQEERNSFRRAQQSAQKTAQTQASWSLEDILVNLMEAVQNTAKTVITGDAKDVTLFDYFRSGMTGIFLVIAVVLSFTGVATLPAIGFIWLLIRGISKGNQSIGLGRFVGSTLGVGLGILLLFWVFLMSII